MVWYDQYMTPREFVLRLGILTIIAGAAFAISGTPSWGFPLLILGGIITFGARQVRKQPATDDPR